jgi:hypothetical protein
LGILVSLAALVSLGALEAVRKLKPFKINALAANALAREKPGNGFHARRQRG